MARTTSYGTPFEEGPRNWERDTVEVTRYVLDDLERRAASYDPRAGERHHAALTALHATRLKLETNELLAAGRLRAERRAREDARVVAGIFSVGLFGLGLAVGVAALIG